MPLPHTLFQVSSGLATSSPEGVLFEMQALPVDVKAVADGDTITVYVRTDDPRQSSSVLGVQMPAVQRARNFERANALHNKIIIFFYRCCQLWYPESTQSNPQQNY